MTYREKIQKASDAAETISLAVKAGNLALAKKLLADNSGVMMEIDCEWMVESLRVKIRSAEETK